MGVWVGGGRGVKTGREEEERDEDLEIELEEQDRRQQS